jgi:hypothetical protein
MIGLTIVFKAIWIFVKVFFFGVFKIILKDEIEFIAVGQSAVFYSGETCIGGAVVDKVVSSK